jgi:proteasome accessory factor C
MAAIQARLRRLLYMIPYVANRPEGVPTDELARVLGVDLKTLAADIAVASLVGDATQDGGAIDIYEEDGVVYTDVAPRTFARPPRLTVAEAFALLAGAQALRGSGIPLYEEAIDRAETKIRAALAESPDALTRREAQILTAGDDRAGLRVVPLLAQAIQERRTVAMDYYSAGRGATERRQLDPYGLVDHGGAWYVVGRCHKHDEVFLFKCERVSNLAVTDATFTPPADVDLERYRRDSLLFAPAEQHHAVLRLRGGLARRLGDWEGARQLADGRLEIRLDNPGLEWLCGWVLRLGADAEVVEPAVLRQAVAARAARIAREHEE